MRQEAGEHTEGYLSDLTGLMTLMYSRLLLCTLIGHNTFDRWVEKVQKSQSQDHNTKFSEHTVNMKYRSQQVTFLALSSILYVSDNWEVQYCTYIFMLHPEALCSNLFCKTKLTLSECRNIWTTAIWFCQFILRLRYEGAVALLSVFCATVGLL